MTFKPIEELTLADNFMFCHIMKNDELCKELLEKLLHIKIDHIIYPELEKELSVFYESKSVRLDVYIKDSDRVFDIEIQNYPQEHLPLRTRYYQSMIDVDNLLKGEEYSNLKESFVIFICTFDPFNCDIPCYTFKNICKENTNVELNDKTTKIIFNSLAHNKEKDIEISAFLKYIKTQEATDDFTTRLNSFVQKAKQNQELRSYYLSMNIHDSDIRREALKEGISHGAELTKIETAKKMIQKNIPDETIAECTGISLEKILELKQTIKK
ncbi:MAG: Rpn family recombination-promoting nuclease/putative transposase [Treponema sp.]|nr:Rpn family recombination-promoting nuclease/putative transposase [Treponema sp.]